MDQLPLIASARFKQKHVCVSACLLSAVAIVLLCVPLNFKVKVPGNFGKLPKLSGTLDREREDLKR